MSSAPHAVARSSAAPSAARVLTDSGVATVRFGVAEYVRSEDPARRKRAARVGGLGALAALVGALLDARATNPGERESDPAIGAAVAASDEAHWMTIEFSAPPSSKRPSRSPLAFLVASGNDILPAPPPQSTDGVVEIFGGGGAAQSPCAGLWA